MKTIDEKYFFLTFIMKERKVQLLGGGFFVDVAAKTAKNLSVLAEWNSNM